MTFQDAIIGKNFKQILQDDVINIISDFCGEKNV